MLRQPPTPFLRRAAAVAAALLLLALVAFVVLRNGPAVREEPQAAASPTPAPTTTEAPPETVVVPTSEEPVEETTTTEPAPEDTEPSGPPATVPKANPGPPVWPSTGAQGLAGRAVTIYDAMNGRIIRRLTDPFGAMPSHPSFRVIEQRGDWLRVSLPLRPNESTGWIKAEDVNLYTTNISIDVDLNGRWITVYDKDQPIISRAVVVGTSSTPTPRGNFFVTDLVPNPGGPFGTYAYGLSGRSNVLTGFAGGDGQIAIHGTNQPQLMGTASSHGCVRVTNDVANQLAKLAMVGIPVRIHAG